MTSNKFEKLMVGWFSWKMRVIQILPNHQTIRRFSTMFSTMFTTAHTTHWHLNLKHTHTYCVTYFDIILPSILISAFSVLLFKSVSITCLPYNSRLPQH